jgi:regulator of RNase E activity RraA
MLTRASNRLNVEIQVPIACGEVAVVPGDIIVGDEEGVIVIPVPMQNPSL